MPDDSQGPLQPDPSTAPLSAAPPTTVVAAAVAIVQQPMDPLDKRLMWIVSGMLGLLAGLMVVCLGLQWQKYDTAIGVALGHPISIFDHSPATLAAATAIASKAPDVPDHAAALTYARALDDAIIKTSALMLSFVVVFLGTLYVLRTSTTQYHLSVTGKETSGTLETSSPGLVMVTLGLLIVAVAVLHRTDIDYQAPTLVTPPAGATAPLNETPPANQPGPAQKGLSLEDGVAH